MSSSTHKRMKRHCSCPKGKMNTQTTGEEPHNSPDWYTREYVPLIGANYNILSNVGVEPRLNGAGMQINVGIVHDTTCCIPVDDDFSAYRQMLLLWEDLREMNSGATNYTPQDLAAYAFNIVTLRALCYFVHRAFASLRYKSPLMRDSPQIYANMCGLANYATETAAYAANMNRAAFLFHDIEQLPIVPFAFLNRVKFLYSTLFADSPTTRPAMIGFKPRYSYRYDVSAGAITATNIDIGNLAHCSIASVLNAIEQLYISISTNNNYATIRGDMLKAFGNGSILSDLVEGLNAPLQYGYNEDVACQLENATLSGFGPATLTMDIPNMQAYLSVSADNHYVANMYNVTQQLINYHGATAPRDGALLALTRLRSIGTVDSSDNITVTCASGVVINYTHFITDTVYNGAPTYRTLSAMMNSLYSSTQSVAVAAYRSLCGLVSLVDRFPQIIIDLNDPLAFIYDVDNFTILDNNTLGDFGQVANRSLLAVRVPRGDNSALRKYMIS